MTTTTTATAAVTFLLLAGCGGGPERQVQPTPRPISAPCAEAWTEAQERSGPSEPPLPDDQPSQPPSPVPLGGAGQAADLYPTLEACGSADEWIEAFAAYPLSWAKDMNGVSLLRELCEHGDQARVSDSQPCSDVGAADEPLDETTDVSPQPS